MKRLLVPTLLALVLLLGWAAPLAEGPLDVAFGTAEGTVPLAFAALWRGAQGLLETGPFGMSADVGWPGSISGVREDPISLVTFYGGFLLFGGGLRGAVAGWNAMHLVFLALGAIGSVVLARELDEDERDRVTNGANDALVLAVFCGSTVALALPGLGHTALLPAMLLPLGLGLLHKTLRTNRWEHAITAGLALAGVSLGGPRTAMFAALIVLPAAWVWTRRWHDDWAKTGVALGIAALALVPHALHVVDTGLSAVTAPTDASWPILALIRVDADAALRGLAPVGYPGLAAITLGLFGQRRGLGWAGLALGVTLLAAGPSILLPGGEMPGPAWPLAAIGMSDWNHLGLFAALPAALAAHAGWRRLTGWRPWVRFAWPIPVLLVLFDAVTWPRPLTPPATWDPTPPTDLAAAVHAASLGALVHLPPGNDDVLLWQPGHGRAITAVPGGDALSAELELFRLGEGPELAVSPVEAEAVRREASRLAGMGAGAFILDREAEGSDRLALLLEAALGPGQDYGRFTTWPL